MKTTCKTIAVMIIALAFMASEANAQGRGRGQGQQQGGQQAMQGQRGQQGQMGQRNQMGRGGASNAQSMTMQRQMMQNRYGQGQSGSYGQGSRGQQQGYGACMNQSGYSNHGYGQSQGNRYQQGYGSQQQGRGQNQGNAMQRQGQGMGIQAAVNLGQNEIDSLVQMREEEKLARDVYLTLANRWNTPVFANIARAESQHMAMVGQLIEVNELNDPITNDKIGVYTNPQVTKMYNELVQAGSGSLSDAYRVGVKIEELDIKDLQESLSGTTDPSMQRVYQNLLRASQNHLRAFSSMSK